MFDVLSLVPDYMKAREIVVLSSTVNKYGIIIIEYTTVIDIEVSKMLGMNISKFSIIYDYQTNKRI